ncbi:MAG: cyclic nucleotide-binding domain-containing protein [Bdellovibrionaceae bacterium]|nr:cyclic nucleotide-binding domain-containing protein [Pseudobdellovibrionaceae bacterium]
MIKSLWNNALYQKEAIYIHSLQQCELLKNLSSGQIYYLLKNLHKRTYQAEENIFQQDSSGNAAYIILEGNVKVHYKEAKAESNLTNTDISILPAGSFFGETNLYQKTGTRVVSATSIKKTILLSLFKADIEQMTSCKPKIAMQLLLNFNEILSTRIMQITQTHL